MSAEAITDLAVVAIIVVSGLFALSRGLVKELLSIASWVGAVFVTLYAFIPARPYVREVIALPEIADVVTAAGLFLGSLFVFWIGAHQVSRVVRNSQAGALDRSLGFLFGLARGALIVVMLYLILTWMLPPAEHPRWIREARTTPLMAVGGRWVVSVLPKEMRARLPAPAPNPGRGEPRKEDGAGQAPPEGAGYAPDVRRDMESLIEGIQ